MARKSKYGVTDAEGNVVKKWMAGLYIRLSREDGDKDESDSVSNQRMLLREYSAKLPDVEVADYFIDDGWTGTNFERPGFIRLMEQIKAGSLNCVIVKDLSRFGRNYIEVGNYLEQIFPFMGVRFISIADSLDSYGNPGQMNTILVPFKNLINDEYCRDISNKVRSSLDSRRRSGKFIGSFSAYGYVKDPDNKGELLVDETVAPIVKNIYEWFLDGLGAITIAKKLNNMGIPSPSEYKKMCGLHYKVSDSSVKGPVMWGYSAVKRILQNRMYCGDLVQGVMRVTSYKVKKLQRVPEDEWMVCENHHEGIVDRETFDKVQRIFDTDTRMTQEQGRITMLGGFMRCADCGRAMNRHKNVHSYGTYHYFVCSTYKKVSKNVCSRHSIRADYVENAVLEAIQAQVAMAVKIDEVFQELEKNEKTKTNTVMLDGVLAGKEREIEKLSRIKEDLYMDWKSNILSKEEFISMKQRYTEDIERMQDEVLTLREEIKKQSDMKNFRCNNFVESFKKHQNIEYLTREVLLELVDTIYVHEGKKITIKFRFRDELQRCRELLELNDLDLAHAI